MQIAKLPLSLFILLLLSTADCFSAEALQFKPVMTLAMANKMADACEQKAKSENWNPVNIAIFDQGGNLQLFRRQDDAYLGSIKIAQLKGHSSAVLPFSTRHLGEKIAYKDPTRPHGIELVPGVVVFPGGLPVKTQSGHLIGRTNPALRPVSMPSKSY